jgi:hypothetical protein
VSVAGGLALLIFLLPAAEPAAPAATPPAALPAATPAGTRTPADPWAPLLPLVGEWVAEPSGLPDEPASATCAFALDLDNHVLVRKNHVHFAPRPGQLHGAVHDDLLVVAREGGSLRATYWDNEGHVIRYAVTSADGAVSLESEAGPGPRFRLTYQPVPDGRYAVTFAIAAPGEPFRPYQTGVMRRR